MYEHYKFIVDPGQEPLRIDKFLINKLKNFSRNKIQTLITLNGVLVNNKKIKSNFKIKPHDTIIIELPFQPRSNEIIPEDIPLDIVYEDDYLLVVNKSAEMVVHPSFNNWTGTLVNALAYKFSNLPNKSNEIGRPGIVHRLDKGTSGLLLVAKTDYAMSFLSRQFFDRSIKRTYVALVWGNLENDCGVVDLLLTRSIKDRRIITTTDDPIRGKTAITNYKVIKKYKYVNLIECKLQTGRTHQIRAHMKSISHPIFGDEKYEGNILVYGPKYSKYQNFIQNCFKILKRQALHAQRLEFIHPISKEIMKFETKLPNDISKVIEKWERYIC